MSSTASNKDYYADTACTSRPGDLGDKCHLRGAAFILASVLIT